MIHILIGMILVSFFSVQNNYDKENVCEKPAVKISTIKSRY